MPSASVRFPALLLRLWRAADHRASTSITQVAGRVEAGPVPTLGRGAILAIDRLSNNAFHFGAG
jgi:hypothetical protein